MRADDLLCSRNARSRTPLVGRAQWKINQPSSLKREAANLEGSVRWMSVVRCAQSRATSVTPFKKEVKNSKDPRWTRVNE